VTGNATATKGNTNGVYGLSASPNGSGVSGVSNASSGGAGVTGFANATSGAAIGVYGQSASTSGNGVNGNATATSGFTTGVTGTSASPGGVGVQGVNNSGGNGVAGFANATSGLNFGVLGVTASSGGVGVQGGNSSTGGFVALAGSSYEVWLTPLPPKTSSFRSTTRATASLRVISMSPASSPKAAARSRSTIRLIRQTSISPIRLWSLLT
jgi:hypothetical protein